MKIRWISSIIILSIFSTLLSACGTSDDEKLLGMSWPSSEPAMGKTAQPTPTKKEQEGFTIIDVTDRFVINNFKIVPGPSDNLINNVESNGCLGDMLGNDSHEDDHFAVNVSVTIDNKKHNFTVDWPRTRYWEEDSCWSNYYKLLQWNEFHYINTIGKVNSAYYLKEKNIIIFDMNVDYWYRQGIWSFPYIYNTKTKHLKRINKWVQELHESQAKKLWLKVSPHWYIYGVSSTELPWYYNSQNGILYVAYMYDIKGKPLESINRVITGIWESVFQKYAHQENISNMSVLLENITSDTVNIVTHKHIFEENDNAVFFRAINATLRNILDGSKTENKDSASEKKSNLQPYSRVERSINRYYELLGKKNLREVYDMTSFKNETSFETFNWRYSDIKRVDVVSIAKESDDLYRIVVDVIESNVITRYDTTKKIIRNWDAILLENFKTHKNISMPYIAESDKTIIDLSALKQQLNSDKPDPNMAIMGNVWPFFCTDKLRDSTMNPEAKNCRASMQRYKDVVNVLTDSSMDSTSSIEHQEASNILCRAHFINAVTMNCYTSIQDGTWIAVFALGQEFLSNSMNIYKFTVDDDKLTILHDVVDLTEYTTNKEPWDLFWWYRNELTVPVVKNMMQALNNMGDYHDFIIKTIE